MARRNLKQLTYNDKQNIKDDVENEAYVDIYKMAKGKNIKVDAIRKVLKDELQYQYYELSDIECTIDFIKNFMGE